MIYNYGDGSGDGVTLLSSSKGEPRMNWVGNYYKPGPNSPLDRPEFATYNGSTGASHQWYGDGNMRWTASGLQAARVGENVGRVNTPFPAAAVTTTSAEQAYTDVLANAGASLVRDDVDQRLVEEVRNGTGSFKNTAGPYPTIAAGTAPADSDGDAMPDAYESAHGTNPSAADANGDADGNGYENIEDWFNSLVDPRITIQPAPSDPMDPADTTPADTTAPGVKKVRPGKGAAGVDRDATVDGDVDREAAAVVHRQGLRRAQGEGLVEEGQGEDHLQAGQEPDPVGPEGRLGQEVHLQGPREEHHQGLGRQRVRREAQARSPATQVEVQDRLNRKRRRRSACGTAARFRVRSTVEIDRTR